MEKKFDIKKFLSNNAIIILIALLALFVGFTTKNFFTLKNGTNLMLNVAPRFIIACGVSGCLITKGTDLSAGRQVGLAACLSAMLLQSVDYAARMLPWLPNIPWFVALLIVMAIMACFGAINGCIIAEMAKQGKSVIMISSEMSELIGMSDRIMVMCDGRCTGFIDGDKANQENIMELATQFE